MRFNTAILFFVALLSCQAFQVPQHVVNSNLIRTIDLTSSAVQETIAVAIINQHTEPVNEYFVALPNNMKQHLAHISAKEKQTSALLPVSVGQYDPDTQSVYYKVDFAAPLAPKEKLVVVITLSYTHVLTPFPAEVPQNGKPLYLFTGNVLTYSPYRTEKQKTNVKLPHASVESYTHTEPVEVKGAKLVYGPFAPQEPFAFSPLRVHFEKILPILTLTNVRRDIEVSHWGNNLAIEEHQNIRHDGAKLKGFFSRLDFQKSVMYQQNPPSALYSLKTAFPPSASDVYFRDEIGNVSTSRYVASKDSFFLDMRPRYPILGGWNYTWYHGYNLPLEQHLKVDNGRYHLKVAFVGPINDAVMDDVEVRIILPEGAENVEVSSPFDIDRTEHSTHFTYFDTTGRYMLVLRKKNVVAEHFQNILISYDYPTIRLLQKPLAASTFFFVAFVLSMIVSRTEFFISKKKTA
ncbi:olygosaccharyltransferase alpha subunit [Basidiobolus meristosporus CBS 931.73]|uniref:Dolichyl-diphosphooligosaccharide--protein glycosyltransferase subunit 1 n=1 Tax=Basidiobolus meristosporus CBS 931.73 TaxID=1314790 RepID=A0A1Y1XIT3_9FUNG|nr:olygosaccharyltransferase alpha subunit [Basidiobolus meristosporus CBS 931.73]|eukprot:ORX85623.1 olygosaccharyltransferase alpha subunit [Basidiobolus meristosporus CBS 931.73]